MERPLPRRRAALLARRHGCRRCTWPHGWPGLPTSSAPHRGPWASINYVASHDGFTLRDAVTYTQKRNHANGEDNRDGNPHEPVWPEGDVRALLATLFLSRGTPMLTAGDEFGRSQQGNNNAYAQDNDVTWLDWSTADHALIRFTSELVKLRKSHPALAGDGFLTGAVDPATGLKDASWLRPDGSEFDWQDATAEVLGLVLAEGGKRLALWFNRSSSFRGTAHAGTRWLALVAQLQLSGRRGCTTTSRGTLHRRARAAERGL